MRVCAEPGCPELTDRTRCPTHRRTRERNRGTRQQRGYDKTHDVLRAKWKRILDTTPWPCARCKKPINVGEPWHLGHVDGDRTKYQGPEHVACNTATASHRSTPGG